MRYDLVNSINEALKKNNVSGLTEVQKKCIVSIQNSFFKEVNGLKFLEITNIEENQLGNIIEIKLSNLSNSVLYLTLGDNATLYTPSKNFCIHFKNGLINSFNYIDEDDLVCFYIDKTDRANIEIYSNVYDMTCESLNVSEMRKFNLLPDYEKHFEPIVSVDGSKFYRIEPEYVGGEKISQNNEEILHSMSEMLDDFRGINHKYDYDELGIKNLHDEEDIIRDIRGGVIDEKKCTNKRNISLFTWHKICVMLTKKYHEEKVDLSSYKQYKKIR